MDNAIDLAMDLIKRFEGFSAKAYKCPAGVWTTGYGRTGADVKDGMVTTRAAEEAWLRKRIESEISYVRMKALNTEIGASLNDNEVAALVSLIYNIGRGAFEKSGVRKALIAGDKKKATEVWQRWNKAGGIVLKGLERRRAAEIALFEKS